MDCRCVNARVSVTGDVRANVEIDQDVRAATSVGTVVIRDGTNDYERLVNKPSINSVALEGDKSLEELGDTPLTNMEIKSIFDRVFRKD